MSTGRLTQLHTCSLWNEEVVEVAGALGLDSTMAECGPDRPLYQIQRVGIVRKWSVVMSAFLSPLPRPKTSVL